MALDLPQVLIAENEAQLSLAKRLFPTLAEHATYVNGGDWSVLKGRRCVALAAHLAPLAYGYASEVYYLPEPMPEGLDDAALKAWIKENKALYNDNAAPKADTPQNPDEAQRAVEPEQLAGGRQLAADSRLSDAAPSSLPPAAPADIPPSERTTQQAGGEPLTEDREQAIWDDFRASHEADDTQTAPERVEARSSVFSVASEDMGHPADLWGQDTNLDPLPVEAFPSAFVQCNQDQAEIMGCDAGMLMMWRLGIAAGCITDEIALQVKANDTHWLARPRCWLMVVGDSGTTMKSPSLDAAMAHAWKIERELRLAGSQALKDHEIECQIYEARKAEYVKARAKGDTAVMPEEPPPPIAERLIVGNSTLEAVSDVLLQQGERGILVRADELLGIISGMNQYKSGKGSDRTEWLEAWNGGPHPIDRKGRAVLVKNWGISLIGGTQPEKIARIGHELETDGLLQRFTVYLPRMGNRGVDRQADKDGLQRYRDTLDRLIKLAPQPMNAPIRFSPEAQVIANEVFDWIFEALRSAWMPAGLRSHLAKWRDIYARFCVIYACIEAADEHHASVQPVISAEIATQVWALMRGLWPHAKQFYLTTLSGTGDKPALRQLAGLILSEGMGEITTRVMTQRSSTYRAAKDAERRTIVGAMCELGWLLPISGKSPISGLPTRYRVNESAHRIYAHIAKQEKRERAVANESWQARKREAGQD